MNKYSDFLNTIIKTPKWSGYQYDLCIPSAFIWLKNGKHVTINKVLTCTEDNMYSFNNIEIDFNNIIEEPDFLKEIREAIPHQNEYRQIGLQKIENKKVLKLNKRLLK